MNTNWSDILERAAWTFAEGFLVALPAAFSVGMDDAALKAAILGAVMSGVSALKTFVLDVIRQKKIKAEEIIEE